VAFLEPGGPYRVGSIVCRLVDTTRSAHLGSGSGGRELYIKVWYPALAVSKEPELLWEELRRDAHAPSALRFLMKLWRTRTATHVGAELDRSGPIASVVVYNHGLISFASENTSLMEHLASRGHVVLAVRHCAQSAELQYLNRDRGVLERKHDSEWTRRMQTAPRDEKSRLPSEYYERSKTTNRIVIERAKDTLLLLDRMAEVVQHVPGFVETALDPAEINLVGFSVGGAVSHEAAARDSRAARVVNLDGGMFGSQPRVAVRQPYLMLYSGVNDGINDALLPPHATCHTAPDTTHLNYHDVSAVLPLLRYTAAIGKVNARAFLVRRNRIVEAFVGGAAEFDVEATSPRFARERGDLRE
jgi:dienelactone hydrolase